MGRSVPRTDLFLDDRDRNAMVQLLKRYIRETGCRCYAWALMRNHYHLLLRTGELELWRTMKPLNMRYAQYHAKRYGRRGPLFGDRYKSIVTQDQNYVQELVRYVHLNPLRAGVCRSLRVLDSYRWTGHSVLMGRQPNLFQDTRAVLARFGSRAAGARQAYRDFLQDGLSSDEETGCEQAVRSSNRGRERGRSAQRWVIGDPEFVAKVMSDAEARRLRVSRLEREGRDLAWLAAKVCRGVKISPHELAVRHRGGPISDARQEFCFVCTREYGVRATDVAAYLGISPGAVSNLVRKRISRGEVK
jgi:REP element-mobilizing transposase RayT